MVSAISGYLLVYWCPETVTVSGQSVPLQQAMIQGQVNYWHSPAAMWLVLGLWAVAGCLIAVGLRGWLTKSAQWTKKGDQGQH